VEDQTLKQLDKVTTVLCLILDAMDIDPAETSINISADGKEFGSVNVAELIAETKEFTKTLSRP